MNSLISTGDVEIGASRAAEILDVEAKKFAPEAMDSASGEAFRYYLLFSSGACLEAADFRDLREDAVFYNRYYWFQRFVKLHTDKHGFDAGLEQQAFQLLELAPATTDWSVVEAIEARAGEEL
jgi:hypothetical protein